MMSPSFLCLIVWAIAFAISPGPPRVKAIASMAVYCVSLLVTKFMTRYGLSICWQFISAALLAAQIATYISLFACGSPIFVIYAELYGF